MFIKRSPKVEKSRSTVSSAVEPDDQVAYSWKAVNVTSYPRGRCLNLFISKKKTEEVSKQLIINGEVLEGFHVKAISTYLHANGIAKPGELLALMGASGAGKSTLLNSLTCRSSHKLLVTGELRINGLPVDDRMLSFISAYVEQDDIFLGNLTVMEHLQFAAKVVMARGTKKKMRNDRIDDLIDDLNLTKCQNTRIGITGKKKGISGGEKKRLAFATGLLNNPALLFCDEPTSGLDSFMSKNVMMTLKRLANQGRTIITTIHQPSSEVYFLFDKVMFLCEGQVAFHGSPTDAQLFFSSIGASCPNNYNPADYFITRLATKYEDTQPGAQPQAQFLMMTLETFAKSKYSKTVLEEIDASKELMDQKKARLSFRMDMSKHLRYQQPWCGQFQALMVRSFKDTIKSRELVSWKFIQTIIVALLFGILYWDQDNDQDSVMNINGAIFISVVNLCIQNCFSVIHVFIDELPVFLREHYNGMYRVDAYYLSKTIVELPLQILLPIIYISIMYYMVKFNQDVDRFLWHTIILILISNIGTSFGYFIGMCTNDLALALNLATPIIIPLILFSGYMCNLDTMSKYLSWLRYVSWFYYSMESLLITQWAGNDDIKCTRLLTTCPKNGTTVLGMFSYKEENFRFDIYMMALLYVTLRIGALGLLHLRVLIKD